MRDATNGHDHGGVPMGGPAEAPAEGSGSGPVDEGPWAVRSAVRAPEIAYRPARRAAVRRGPADPVKVLMHRHRDLCERAVDPLEIAAGLEAHGLTDRTAARYRHRDVFSLAEELYARVPAAGRSARAHDPRPRRDKEARAGWTLTALLPGAACLATAGALRATEGVLGGGARFAVTAGGALLVLAGLRLCLRAGPLRAPAGAGGVSLYVCWLLGYAVYGDDLIDQVISGGPDGHWTAAPAPCSDSRWPSPPRPGAPTCSPHTPATGSPAPTACRSSVRGCAPCSSASSRSSCARRPRCCTSPASATPAPARASPARPPSAPCSCWPGC